MNHAVMWANFMTVWLFFVDDFTRSTPESPRTYLICCKLNLLTCEIRVCFKRTLYHVIVKDWDEFTVRLELLAKLLFCSFFIMCNSMAFTSEKPLLCIDQIGFGLCVYGKMLWLIYCVLFYDVYWLRLTRVLPSLVVHI